MGVNYSGTRTKPRLDLGTGVQEFIDNADDWIGTKLLPIFKTKVSKGSFSAVTRETLTQNPDAKRAPSGAYNRIVTGAKDKSFICQDFGLENPLDDSERAMYATDFDAELAASQTCAAAVLRAQEIRIKTLMQDTAVFTGSALTTDVSGTAPWATAGSDIVATVLAAKEKVRQNTGMRANAVWFSHALLENAIKKNTDIKARIQYVARVTDAEIRAALADMFGVKYVFVAGGIYNGAKEGQTFSASDIWGSTYAGVCVVAEDPAGKNLKTPGVGRTFLWEEDSPENALVEEYRDEPIRSNVYRVRQNTDEVIIDQYFAHLLKVA